MYRFFIHRGLIFIPRAQAYQLVYPRTWTAYFPALCTFVRRSAFVPYSIWSWRLFFPKISLNTCCGPLSIIGPPQPRSKPSPSGRSIFQYGNIFRSYRVGAMIVFGVLQRKHDGFEAYPVVVDSTTQPWHNFIRFNSELGPPSSIYVIFKFEYLSYLRTFFLLVKVHRTPDTPNGF